MSFFTPQKNKLILLTSCSIALTNSAIANMTTDNATDIKPVIVSANHQTMPKTMVTAETTVITAADIAEKNYVTLDEAIRGIPGIQTSRNGGYGSVTSLFINGQSNRSILVLVDGIEMNNPVGTGGAIMGNLLLGDVARIEIIKGAQSGIWGSRASAGVINIITKHASELKQMQNAEFNSGSVNVELGSNNTQKLGGTFSAGNAQGDFTFNFSQYNTDGYSAVKNYKKDSNNFESDAFTQSDISLSSGINLSQKHRLEFFIKNSDATSEYDLSSDPDSTTSFGSALETSYENQIKQLKHVYKTDNFNSQLYLSQNEITQYSEAVINTTGIKGGYAYAEDQSLAFILEGKHYQNRSKNDSYLNSAVGLTNTNSLVNNKLTLTQSIRFDEFNQFDNKATGKLGVKAQVSEDIAIKANYGTAYNAPTLFQLTYGITNDLNPEETRSFDLGISWRDLSITYYKSEIDQLIEYDDGGTSYLVNFGADDSYSNLEGVSTFEGINLEYSKYIDSMNTQIGFNLATTSAKDSKKEWLARVAETTAGLNFLYDGFNNLSIIGNTRYIGKKYDKANQEGKQIGEYFVTDLSLNYDVNKNLMVFGRILNVFDTDYTNAVASYETDNVTPKTVYSTGGRQIFIGLQASM